MVERHDQRLTKLRSWRSLQVFVMTASPTIASCDASITGEANVARALPPLISVVSFCLHLFEASLAGDVFQRGLVEGDAGFRVRFVVGGGVIIFRHRPFAQDFQRAGVQLLVRDGGMRRCHQIGLRVVPALVEVWWVVADAEGDGCDDKAADSGGGEYSV